MEKKKSFIINSIYLAVWILIIYFLITFASAYLLPFLIGIIIAHLVQKPAVFMNKKIGIKKNKCAAILSVIIYLFVSIIIFLFFWFIFFQFNRFVKFLSNNSEQLKIYFDNIFLKIESLLNKFNVDNVKTLYNDAINSLIVNVTSYFSNAITSLLKNTPTVLLSCVVTIVSTCYIAKDYDKILQFVKGFVSEKFIKVVTEIPEFLQAPIEENQKVGSVKVLLGEKILKEYKIYANENVKEVDFGFSFLKLLKSMTTL